MLPDYIITYIDYNNIKRYFFSIAKFLKYLEFTSSFPGLFSYETNDNIYKWTVKYNKEHTKYTFIELMDYVSGKLVISQYDTTIRGFVNVAPEWWLSNPLTYEQIIGIYTDDFGREYVNTSIWYVSSEKMWYGVDAVLGKSYVSPNLKDVLPAILVYWPATEYTKLSISEM